MPELSYQIPGLIVKRPGTGASDAQIRDLQRHLRALGSLRQGIDGAFGRGTEGAVRDFQTQEGLVVDGIVGAATLGALRP